MKDKKTATPRSKPLVDRYGVIREATKMLPDEKLQLQFLAALGELEDNEAHRQQRFPVPRLHKVKGVQQSVYRADVDKNSGWRLHLQYAKNDELHLKDLLPPDKHDRVIESIRAKSERYE